LIIPITIPELNNGMNLNLSLYTIQGNKITTITDKTYPSGFQQVLWDRHDNNGTKVQSGFYIVRMKLGAKIQSRKIMLE